MKNIVGLTSEWSCSLKLCSWKCLYSKSRSVNDSDEIFQIMYSSQMIHSLSSLSHHCQLSPLFVAEWYPSVTLPSLTCIIYIHTPFLCHQQLHSCFELCLFYSDHATISIAWISPQLCAHLYRPPYLWRSQSGCPRVHSRDWCLSYYHWDCDWRR